MFYCLTFLMRVSVGDFIVLILRLKYFTELLSLSSGIRWVRMSPTARCRHCRPRPIQEALLPQTDRATRRVSRNLVNCCTVFFDVYNKFTKKSMYRIQ